MGKNRYRKQPLLYIHQPNTEVQPAHMQSDYYTPEEQNRKEIAESNENKKSNRRPIKRYNIVEDEMDTHAEESESEEEEEKFNNMTLQEKVVFFVQRSNQTTAVIKCEVRTENKKYQGVIVDFKDDVIYMKLERRTQVREISFPEITHIRMLGF